MALLSLSAARAQAQPTANIIATRPPVHSLNVTGQGEVTAAPDQALVRVGVEAEADQAVAAQTKINNAMHQAIERIRKIGIADEAIQTTGLSLMPVYANPNPGTQTIAAYRASNVIQIRIDDLARLGRVLDAAVSAGANRLEGVSFQLKNDLPQQTRALQLAVEQARTKAKAMAEALHLELGPVQSISERGGEIRPPRPMMMRASVSTPIETGEIQVQASVTVEYELR